MTQSLGVYTELKTQEDNETQRQRMRTEEAEQLHVQILKSQLHSRLIFQFE